MAAQVQIFADAAALSEAAAALFVTEAQTAVSNHQRFLVTLSGGTTPAAMFRLLATPPLANQVPWPMFTSFGATNGWCRPTTPAATMDRRTNCCCAMFPFPRKTSTAPRGSCPRRRRWRIIRRSWRQWRKTAVFSPVSTSPSWDWAATATRLRFFPAPFVRRNKRRR